MLNISGVEQGHLGNNENSGGISECFHKAKTILTLGQRSNAAIHRLCSRREQEPGGSLSSLGYGLNNGLSNSLALSSLTKSVEISFEIYTLLAAAFAL